MTGKLSFEEYYAKLKDDGEIDCSCHIHPPCSDCMDASGMYEEYLKEGEEDA